MNASKIEKYAKELGLAIECVTDLDSHEASFNVFNPPAEVVEAFLKNGFKLEFSHDCTAGLTSKEGDVEIIWIPGSPDEERVTSVNLVSAI